MKTKYKNLIITLVLLVCFFPFSVVFGTLGDGFNENLITEKPLEGNQVNIENTANGIVGNIVYVVQVLAVAGVVIMGVRYMFSSAEKRADIKKDSINIIIGLVIVFATSFVIKLIVDSAEQML